MQIRIKPSDIIERCLFLDYKKFILKDYTEAQIKEIIEKDEPFIISEDDAYVIKLLKCVKTTNLIHKFSKNITELVDIKNHIDKEKEVVVISKASLLSDIENFKNSFPTYYNGDENMMESIKEMKVHVDSVLQKINKLEIILIELKNKTKIPCYRSKDVIKILKKW